MSTLIQSADDLRARIRELASTEPNPAVVADHILRRLTSDEFRVVAFTTLAEFARVVMQKGPSLLKQPVIVPQTRTYETASGAVTPSRKVAALRDWVERELQVSVCVGEDSHREYKFLGDCSSADLEAAALSRHRKAAELEAKAEWLENVAKAVEHAGVETVRDLPRETLEAVLRR